MKKFSYTGKNKDGKPAKGSVTAENTAKAVVKIRRLGILPQQVREEGLAGASGGDFDLTKLFERSLPLSELIMFLRQMYALTKAGVPMIRAITGLAKNTGNKQLSEALSAIIHELERGRSLSVAMSEHPKCFPDLVIAVVNVGENTGKLEESFNELGHFLEKEQETRRQVKQATRYPTFVMIALAIAMVVLNIFVIPTFADMFANLNIELPLATKVLMATSKFFVNYWYLVLLMGVATVIGVRYALTKPGPTLWWDDKKLRMPIVGKIVEESLLGRFCNSFSMMLKSGIPLIQALNLVADALDNKYMASKIQEMRDGVSRGENLERVATNSQLFSSLVLQMISVGEETGNLDELLIEAAGYYEREVEYDLSNLLARIEPILIGFVALLVGVLAMGIFLPMWNMMDVTGQM